MKTFTFDCKLFATITVQAESLEAARADVLRVMNCASINCGADAHGNPVIGEASIDGEPDYFDHEDTLDLEGFCSDDTTALENANG